MGRPAVLAAVAVGPMDGISASRETQRANHDVGQISSTADALAAIASQLRSTNLRKIADEPVPAGERVFALADEAGKPITRLAWTPKQPGAEIVHSVVPFIAVALAGFAMLAAFVLRYMRRTAAAIAAGEIRLRHLAMHDPLCGLPNRIYLRRAAGGGDRGGARGLDAPPRCSISTSITSRTSTTRSAITSATN